MKLTIETLGHIPAEPIPDSVRIELLQRFQSWKR